jgi:hypothetical protein
MAEWKKVVVSGSSAELAGLTVTNNIVGSITGNAATVTTNAALTGDVTSNGSTNATTIANDAVTTIKILDANVTNAKLANDGLMIGSTDISLGATGSSLAGLTLTGAVGSGSFSGSFQGDGSLLTGLPDATDSKFLVFTTGSGTNGVQSIGNTIGTTGAAGTNSIVAGGQANDADGDHSGVFAGNNGTAEGKCSVVIGGKNGRTTTSGCYSVVLGGCSNTLGGKYSTVSGYYNTVDPNFTTVSGRYNSANSSGTSGVIAGGQSNCLKSIHSGILAGKFNETNGDNSTVSGGYKNEISSAGDCSAIVGGQCHNANAARSVILGGDSITATVADHVYAPNLTTAGSITGSAISASGAISASAFIGDGSALTGLPSAPISTYTGGVSNRIITAVDGSSVEGEANLTFDGTTLAVTGDATISRDVTISRNLIVQGTASFQSTEDLDIKDRFIRMASGSTSAGDGGIVIQQTNALNGEVFGFDSTSTRFGLSGSFDASQNAFTPDAFLSAVVVGGTGETKADVVSRYQKPGNIFVQDNGEVHIYV